MNHSNDIFFNFSFFLNIFFFSLKNQCSQEADKLAQDGVKIIIALGHSGYEMDKEIAKNCPLVDVVVGAHSHTLLTNEDSECRKGPYPTVIEQISLDGKKKKIPVVQTSAYSKYIGVLNLTVSILK